MQGDRVQSGPPAKRSLKAIYALIIGVVIALAAWLFWPARDAPTPIDAVEARASADRSDVELRLQAEAFRLSQGLPKQIDEKITLTRVSASGLTVTYQYLVDAARDEEAVVRNFAENSIFPQVCLGKLRTDLRDKGVTYRFRYESDNFPEAVVVAIDEAACRARFAD